METIDAVSWQKFVDILGGDEDAVQEIADLFLEESRSVGDAVLDAIAAGDAEATRRMAHRLKSSSRQLGALPLSETAQRLEEVGAQGDLEQAEALAPVFRQRLEEARQAVARLIVA